MKKNHGMKQHVMAIGLMGLLAGGAALAWAEPPAGAPGDPPEGQEMAEVQPRLDGLNLTDQQVTLLKKERMATHKLMITMRAEMETARVDLRAAVETDKPDLANIETLTKKIGELQGEMLAEHVKGAIYLRSILTPEQKKILDARMLEAPPFERGRHGKWQHKEETKEKK